MSGTTISGTPPKNSPAAAFGAHTETYLYEFLNRLTTSANTYGSTTFSMGLRGRITGSSFTSGPLYPTPELDPVETTETTTARLSYNRSGRPETQDVTDGVTDVSSRNAFTLRRSGRHQHEHAHGADIGHADGRSELRPVEAHDRLQPQR